RAINDVMISLPDPERLTPEERRGIIARYAAVLEGNFIYWMTAAHLAVASDEAKAIIEDNLLEEVRDNHPGMLRRFVIAAHAVPTDSDALAVYRHLESVRQFVAQLSPVKTVLMMAFFEGWITRFMAYLADLARRQGSTEFEYTDVHGVVDVVHTAGLLRALEAEMARLDPAAAEPPTVLLTGVETLRALIETVIRPAGAVTPPIAVEAAAAAPGVATRVACTATIAPVASDRVARRQTEWILLTSGTTGRPKLVAHTLSSLAAPIIGGAGVPTAAVWATFYDIRRYGGLQI